MKLKILYCYNNFFLLNSREKFDYSIRNIQQLKYYKKRKILNSYYKISNFFF